MEDTSAEIQRLQREIIFGKTMQERFAIGIDAINFGRTIVINSIRNANPDISEVELKIALLKLYYESVYSKEEFDLIVKALITYTQANPSNP
jgi:hypothetical protein